MRNMIARGELIGVGVLAVIVATFLLHWSSATIEVTGAVLRAGRDTLALSEVSQVIALDERQSNQLRGPRADPSAHILLRPYLKRHYMQAGVGHYGVFSGARWTHQIYPIVKNLILAMD